MIFSLSDCEWKIRQLELQCRVKYHERNVLPVASQSGGRFTSRRLTLDSCNRAGT